MCTTRSAILSFCLLSESPSSLLLGCAQFSWGLNKLTHLKRFHEWPNCDTIVVLFCDYLYELCYILPFTQHIFIECLLLSAKHGARWSGYHTDKVNLSCRIKQGAVMENNRGIYFRELWQSSLMKWYLIWELNHKSMPSIWRAGEKLFQAKKNKTSSKHLFWEGTWPSPRDWQKAKETGPK